MPRSRFDELAAIAQEHDGLLTSKEARDAGITDSVLARLTQRGRLERVARGVYRLPYFSPDRLSQYREVILWAKANRGPEAAALSHLTALALYGISDANPDSIHLTVPKQARLRRQIPRGVVIHRQDLAPGDIAMEEDLPVTTVGRTVADLLQSGGRINLIQQAVRDARRGGLITDAESRRLLRQAEAHLRALRENRQRETQNV
ncbi:type IV toxin-antitoxin system AbiEi family antitoxin domain-containing protein [uncultured Paludibaculum sp.]|uniref:type IV toxin-antitoxin system AbiEi family antitoxin domain-containing protein n=1 Tax=uncultured Paludibaculum sp. TaxID=1765020 RepID=UPI002AABC7FB|nr:type IV toxin-antitoxin system AbiEi family antitoxin domain-containing protein [uncultured Paludibaculum sp.]